MRSQKKMRKDQMKIRAETSETYLIKNLLFNGADSAKENPCLMANSNVESNITSMIVNSRSVNTDFVYMNNDF